LKDQETNQTKILDKLLGSFLIIFSVAILFTDRVTTFGITNTYGFKDPETFIWIVSQSFSPILLAIGAMMRPYRVFYFVPVYIYSIQIYWVFDPTLQVDDPLLHLYAAGCSVGVFIFFCIALYLTKQLTRTNRILIRNIKKSVHYVAIFISDKYIEKLPQEDKENYTVDTVKYIDSLEK